MGLRSSYGSRKVLASSVSADPGVVSESRLLHNLLYLYGPNDRLMRHTLTLVMLA